MGKSATLRILQQALAERGGGFNWVCTGQMWFSAGNCWEQRGMGVGTSKLDEKIKNAGHVCIQPTRKIVWPPLAKAEMGVERVVCLPGFWLLQFARPKRRQRQRWDSDRQNVRCASHPWKDITSPDAVSLLETVQWALQTCGW